MAHAPVLQLAVAPHAAAAPALAATNLALCQQPAATVVIAPATQTMTTTSPVAGCDDKATTPATVNMAAAAS